MILVDEILVSDLVVETRFSCQLHECRGACCQEGELGSPISREELETISRLLPDVLPDFPEQRRRQIETEGFFVREGPRIELRCLPDGRCVFASLLEAEGPLTCLLQKAHADGRSPFPKPRYCQLFPLRVEHFFGRTCVNFEPRTECRQSMGVGPSVVEFCRSGLIRVFGDEWYDRLLEAIVEERHRTQRTS